MAKNQEIEKGDNVRVIVEAWKEDEIPTIRNFYEGKVTEVVERAKHCFYVRINGLDKLIPVERICRDSNENYFTQQKSRRKKRLN